MRIAVTAKLTVETIKSAPTPEQHRAIADAYAREVQLKDQRCAR